MLSKLVDFQIQTELSLQYALASMIFALNRFVKVRSQQECAGTEVGDFWGLPVMEEDLRSSRFEVR